MPDADNSSASNWSSRDKFAVVMETAAMSQAEIAEYCREKGLFPEQLVQWRQAEFVKTVAAFFYAASFNFCSGLSGLRTMISGLSQFLVSPLQRDGLAALARR